MYWLLAPEVLHLRAARAGRGAIFARGLVESEPRPLPLAVAGSTATIRVEGVLTPTPDRESAYYGEPNTTYPDISAALATALADEKVSEIVFSIDSPGGSVDGLFECLDAIAAARESGGKPIRVRAESAQSAAYGIAAAAGPIEAVGRTSAFGSIGVAASFFLQGGIFGEQVDITNSGSPDKRPNLDTPDGKAVVVRYLDQLADEFVSAIAAGRGIAAKDVLEAYGRGASFIASHAKRAGLIDSIAKPKRKPMTTPKAETEIAPVLAAPITPEAAAAIVQLAREPVPDFAPLAAVNAELAAAKAELAALRAGQHEVHVDSLVRDGKLAPSLRAWAVSQSRATLDGFVTAAPPMAAAAPAVSTPAITTGSPALLTAEERAIIKQLNVKPADFLATRAKQLASNLPSGVYQIDTGN